MKRLIVALMVGGVLFVAAWGAAAGLIVDGRALQAGSDEVLMCDDDPAGVQIWYTVIWDAGLNEHVVDKISVGGVNEACNGMTVDVVLTDINGDKLGQASDTKQPQPPAGNPRVDFIPNIPVDDVYDVHVAIY